MTRTITVLVWSCFLLVGCSMPRSLSATALPTTTLPAAMTVEAPEPPVSGVPTLEPTLATLQLAVYPPEARTGDEALDGIIDAVLRHDVESLRSLTRYLVIGCTHAEGLGGPPKCTPEETEGTPVEAVPFLGPEGHHQRRAEYETWPGPDALGLLAAYRVGPGTYSDEPYPAGEYALLFLDANPPTIFALQVSNAQVVRFDYKMGGSIQADLEREADSFLLPLSFNPIPTAVPWTPYADPEGRFSFVYPPTMTLAAGDRAEAWRLGDRIEFFLKAPGASYVACFDQALGDCPVVLEDGWMSINGADVRRVKGYFGAVGGMVPQEFLTYIFPVEGEQLVFTVYALPFDAGLQDITQIWPLQGMELELFERLVTTVTLK